MALRLSITAKGADAVAAALARLTQPRLGRVLARGLKTAARDVQRSTRQHYLSGQLLARRTGDLYRSIAIDPRPLPKAIFVGTNHPGAGPLHFGWPARGMPARPFLERAARREEPKIADGFAKLLLAEVTK